MRRLMLSCLFLATLSPLVQPGVPRAAAGAKTYPSRIDSTAISGHDVAGRLTRMIMRAYRSGDGSVIVPPGIYELGFSSEAAYLSFRKIRNFQIIGHGVTLVRSDPTKGCFSFSHCRNVELRGFTLCCDPFDFTQGRIIAIGRRRSYFDMRVCKGYPLDFTDQRRFPLPAFGMVFSPKTHLIETGSNDIHSSHVMRISKGVFRVWTSKGGSLSARSRVGDLVAFRGYVVPDVQAYQCRAMTFENITVRGGTGFGFREILGYGNNRYIHCRILYASKPKGATVNPLLATNADGFHSMCVRHGPALTSCFFEGMGDDGIAIHGSYALALHTSGRHWTVVFPWHLPSFIRPGDKLDIYDPHGGLLGETSVSGIQAVPRFKVRQKLLQNMCFAGNPPLAYALTLTRSVRDAGAGDRISDLNANGSDFTIRGCTVSDNRARGILIKASDGIIVNNTVSGSTIAGIMVTPEFSWYEAGVSCNLLIADNTVRNVGYATTGPWNFQAGAISLIGHTNDRAIAFGHSGVAIVGNRLVRDNGINLEIADAQDVLVSNNRFFSPMWRPNDRGASWHLGTNSLMWMQDCKNVLLAENKVIDPGPAMKHVAAAGPNVHNIFGAKSGFSVAAKRKVVAAVGRK